MFGASTAAAAAVRSNHPTVFRIHTRPAPTDRQRKKPVSDYWETTACSSVILLILKEHYHTDFSGSYALLLVVVLLHTAVLQPPGRGTSTKQKIAEEKLAGCVAGGARTPLFLEKEGRPCLLGLLFLFFCAIQEGRWQIERKQAIINNSCSLNTTEGGSACFLWKARTRESGSHHYHQ